MNMADASFEAKARTIANMTARATVNRMRNEGMGLTLEEAQQVSLARNSNATEFFCANCGHPLSDGEAKGSRCGICRSTKMTDVAPYRCVDCKEPLSIKAKSCPRCGGEKAIKTNSKTLLTVRNPVPHYTCKDCLRPVNLEQPSCSCGGREAYRTVVR